VFPALERMFVSHLKGSLREYSLQNLLAGGYVSGTGPPRTRRRAISENQEEYPLRSRTALGLSGIATIVGLAAAAATFAPHAFAQDGAAPVAAPLNCPIPDGPPPGPTVTINDPAGGPPNPTHIVMTLPNQYKWVGNQSLLYGDPTKPGDPYEVLVKLQPGEFSTPHTLSTDRWVFVVSGTLWVSDKDAKSSYPVKGNNFITNIANTSFADGNRAGAKEPTVLLISGVGSADNHIMGEYSKKTSVSVSDPEGPAPDVSHMTIADVPTTGNPDIYGGGQRSTEEGKPYGVVQTWTANHFSSPHYHPHPRNIYVLQGPWWVSSANVEDPKTTYPVPTGAFVQDLPHGIHWDGNREGQTAVTRLYITGVAPATNHGVDANGQDLPPPTAEQLAFRKACAAQRNAGRGRGAM
jgi:hypothetical protein